MATVEQKLDEAKSLIQQKRYKDARLLLRVMGNNQTAVDWLKKIDELDPPKTQGSSRGLSIIVMIVGIAALIWSFIHPFMYSLSSGSAIQATQVYTESIHIALLGIGCILLAILFNQYSSTN